MAYSPTPIRRESVISQAAQEICRFIEAEKLGPGEALPPETRLSQMLGISRNSLREALRVLHGLGHVEKTAGRRVVVTAAGQGGKSVFDQSVLVEAAHVSFHAFLLASARNPLLVAMFNQAQVARLSNVAPQHKGFYDPRHLAHHRALLRALRRRDARAAAAAVRRHYRSLGLMLAVVSR